MKILFQSDDVVVVHKPAGWLSVPSIQGHSDPRQVVGIELRQTFGSVYPVHRLDFEVEGVLLFALHPKAQSVLHKIWEDRDVKKTYHAITQTQMSSHWPPYVSGLLQDKVNVEDSGVWKSLIVQGKRRSFIGPHGQKSETEFKLLKHNEQAGTLLWELSPLTGRRHQLRLELSRRGFPVLGDKLYGSGMECEKDTIRLAATRLNFDKKFNLNLPDEIKIEWNKE